MPLRSLLFSKNDRLQACLVSDPAHVMPGSVGQYVQLIQLALGMIDGLAIDQGEFESMRYGPTTTAAVLAYKRKRKIINYSYQRSEDSVVGKMTIASLDKDICAIEETERPGPTYIRPICRRPGCGVPLHEHKLDLPPISRTTLLAIAEPLRKA